MKKIILTKAALLALLYYAYDYAATKYYAEEAWMVIPFLFGIYMVVIPLFIRTDVRFRIARIVCGAFMFFVTASCSYTMNKFLGDMILYSATLLAVAIVLGLPVLFIMFAFSGY